MRNNHHAVPSSYLLLKREGKILLMLRQGTGYYDDWYCVPAGHVEEGELPIDGLIREAKEEVGLDLNRENIEFSYSMYRTAQDQTGDRCDYFYTVTDFEGEPENCEENKCAHIEWFDLDNLPDNVIHHIKDAIEAIERGEVFSELGRDEVHKNPKD